MLITPGNGKQIMTPSGIRSVPQEPRFDYAIQSATGYEISWRNKPCGLKRKRIPLLFSPVAVGSFSPAGGDGGHLEQPECGCFPTRFAELFRMGRK